MIYELGDQKPSLPPKGDYFVADTARVIGDVILHPHASIWFGAILRGDIEPIEIGAYSSVQDNCTVHTSRNFPVRLGEGVTVGHQATLHGCTIGNNCLIGMKATIMDGCEIGDNCIIGAGSLLGPGKKIPSGSLVVGSPARVIRSLSEERIEEVRQYARRYFEYYRRYIDTPMRPFSE